MSWLHRHPDISEEALECVGFKPMAGCGFSVERTRHGADRVRNKKLATDEEWKQWLDEEDLCAAPAEGHRINLILGGRSVRPWGHDAMILSQLPWTRLVFSHMVTRLAVHSQILTAINRNTSCLFSRVETTACRCSPGEPPRRAWVYNCRTSALWPGDMALSCVTFLPDSRTTHAVLFGCDQVNRDRYDKDMTLGSIITSRLSSSDASFAHPMLLPAVFADLERDRQIELVRDETARLGERIHRLASTTAEREKQQPKPKPKQKPAADAGEGEGEEASAMIWLGISKLRNGLGDWQRQLRLMIEHVDELREGEFAVQKQKPEDAAGPGGARGGALSETDARLAREEGARIRDRLRELVDAYDQYIRECTHMMDGMSLATQLELSSVSHEHSQVNLEVARQTQRDRNMMKSLATLGMIFLPATFVTGFFSMGLSDWGNGSVYVSGYVWVYAVAALAATCATLTIFYCLVVRKNNKVPGQAGSV